MITQEQFIAHVEEELAQMAAMVEAIERTCSEVRTDAKAFWDRNARASAVTECVNDKGWRDRMDEQRRQLQARLTEAKRLAS